MASRMKLKLSVPKVTQKPTATKTVERLIPRGFLVCEQVDVDGGGHEGLCSEYPSEPRCSSL